MESHLLGDLKNLTQIGGADQDNIEKLYETKYDLLKNIKRTRPFWRTSPFALVSSCRGSELEPESSHQTLFR